MPPLVRRESLFPFLGVGWISSCKQFFYVILDAPDEISYFHFVILLRPSRRFNVHEPSDHPLTAYKKAIHPLTNAGLAFFCLLARLPKRRPLPLHVLR
jgi:hypothetical protein